VRPPARRWFLAIALLSAGAIAYEVLLIRLFSIIQWHHFAYMVISLALLGYGASGTAIALARGWLQRHAVGAVSAGALLFAIAAPAAFAIGQRLPFNPLELAWDPWQLVYLAGLYLLLAVPFFGAALSIGLSLVHFDSEIGNLYFADLAGAGLGALAVIAALFLLPAAACLTLIGAMGLLAAALLLPVAGARRVLALLPALAVAGVAVLAPPAALQPRLSPYKELSQTLELPEARVIAQRHSPLGRLDVVASPAVPLRHAPGLSLHTTTAIPPQLGVFTDGDGPTAIIAAQGDPDADAFLDDTLAALPYVLRPQPRVLVLGAGGGSDVALALRRKARRIDAVELNPQLAALVRTDFARQAGHIYAQPSVFVHLDEARHFVAATPLRYDVIQLAMVDSFTSAAAGLHALNESTLYTTEALQSYLSRLQPSGVLAITRWLKLPPRDSLKLFATAVEALRARGVADPDTQLALLRSWDAVTLLAKLEPFSDAERTVIRRFADQRGFDLAHLPGLRREEANRHNVLATPMLFDGARALLAPTSRRFLASYKYDLRPASDDRPFFFHVFTWRLLPELRDMQRVGRVALLEWGYVVLLATLVQAALFSVMLIALPLLGRRRPEARAPRRQRASVLLYFLALGLGFLFLEIAFMHRLSLLLGHPLYAAAVVLAGILVFAGLGSGLAQRLSARPDDTRPHAPVVLAVAGIAVLALAGVLVLPQLSAWLAPAPAPLRVLAALALVAPLGFCMGLPFPLGLRRLAMARPALVPWAWAINGCASVLSAVLATLLAIQLGFTAVVLLAVCCYLVAALVLPGLGPPLPRQDRGDV